MINESVRLTAKFFGCLTEMFVEGKRNLKDGAFILAYRSKVWVFGDRDSFENASARMASSIKKEAQIKRKGKVSFTEIEEERPDILQAVFHKHSGANVLEILPGFEMQQQMETSPLVKKVAQTLGCSSVTFSDRQTGDVTQDADVEDLKPGDPTWGFHGTSSHNLLGLLTAGLKPKPDRGNYTDRNVVHYDHIFLTMDVNKAIHHATNACAVKTKSRESRGYGDRISYITDNSGKNLLYQPIIIKTKIPDPSLIDSDYDIDRMSGQTTYSKMYSRSKSEFLARDKGKMPGNSVKLSKRLGVFGYKGKIIPQQFIEVQIGPKISKNDLGSDLSINDFHAYNVEDVRSRLKQLIDAYGGDMQEAFNIDLRDYMGNSEQYLDEIRGDQDAE